MNPFKAKAKKSELAEAAAAPMTKLEERREELRQKFTELQFDLGGAAYEMAARDYFRLDVLAKMAARLQLVDAELAEIERMARLEKAGASGSCPGCGSLHAQGAVYCWRCGRNLHETTQAVVSPLATVPTPNGVAQQVVGEEVSADYGFHQEGDQFLTGEPETYGGPAGATDGRGLGDEMVDLDPGPRNHPNVGPPPGDPDGQRTDWPSA